MAVLRCKEPCIVRLICLWVHIKISRKRLGAWVSSQVPSLLYHLLCYLCAVFEGEHHSLIGIDRHAVDCGKPQVIGEFNGHLLLLVYGRNECSQTVTLLFSALPFCFNGFIALFQLIILLCVAIISLIIFSLVLHLDCVLLNTAANDLAENVHLLYEISLFLVQIVTVAYDMNNDKATDMYLILIPFAGDTAQWDNRLYVKLGTVAQGESSGGFELSSYEEIRNAANSANSIYITGIAFGLEEFVTDDTMNLKDLYFAPEDVTSSAEFSYQGGGISKISDGTSVTFTADVAVTGDPSVTYKWYVDGVQTDANGSEFTVSNDTVGNHSVYGVVCVGDDYYTAARYVSETVSYGAYMEADVSLDGKVNAEDLSAMRIKLITSEALSDIEKLSADLNGDGEVDILDLIKIKKLMSENVG